MSEMTLPIETQDSKFEDPGGQRPSTVVGV